MQWYALDTETSNSKKNIELKYTRVWLWDIFDPRKRFHYTGTDIETMISWIFSLNKNAIFYIHNLKFDGAFIIDYLLKNGFRISDQRINGCISTLITDRLVWYSFVVYYNNFKFTFRDSAKKIIGSLEQAANDFDLPIKKGEIDYNKHRDKGYEPSNEEIDYVHNDTEILADILQYYFDNGMTGLTNATDAMKAYKRIIGNKAYDSYFPKLSKDIDDFIRKSYKGGFCYLNPKFKEIDLEKVYTYDVKSMYPSVMHDCQLPYGVPIHYTGKYVYDETMPLYIQHIRCDCKIKKGHIPVIQTKAFLAIRLNYLEDTDGQMIDLYLTNIDLKLLLDHYEVFEIHYIEGYKFQSTDILFKNYIDTYFKLKESSKGAKKTLYKIFLNSLYGKFAMMCERTQAEPYIDENRLKFYREEPQIIDPVYTAVASFITSNARKKLLDGIFKNLDSFVYCDTDSIHLIKEAKNIDEGNNLGQFAIENGYYENGKAKTYVQRGRYLGQKCYMLLGNKNGNKYELKKIAGAPKKVKESINFDNFYVNFSSDANMYPKFRMETVDGGVLLVPTSFTIKDKNRNPNKRALPV